MAINRISPKKGKVVDIPDAVVTIGTPTAGDSQVSVAFTATSPATGGPVQKYTAISSPGSVTVSGSTSPVVVTGLTNDTAYTFTVAAGNATGNGVFSSASASATPIGTSYESIATQTVGAGGAASVTFSSIPSTYKHLQLRIMSRADRSGAALTNLFIQINGNSTTPYTHYLYGDGSATSAGNFTDPTGEGAGYLPAANAGANMFGASIIDILDYTNTNKYKTIRTLGGLDLNGSGRVFLFSSADMTTTSAITQIVLTSGYNFTQYSTFALYGIKG